MKGMLWLDADKQRPLAQKIERALAYFYESPRWAGKQARLIQANVKQLADAGTVNGRVPVEGSSYVLPDHLLIVVEQ